MFTENFMKNKYLNIFAILSFFMFGMSFNAFSYTLKECLEISDVVNADVPQKVDPMTDLVSTHCKLGPYFVYNYALDNSITAIPNNFKKVTIKKYCSLPTFKPILNGMKGVELDYFNKKGKFLDKVQFSKSDC